MADWDLSLYSHFPLSVADPGPDAYAVCCRNASASCFDTNIRSNNSIIKENATCTAQWTRET